MAISADEFTFLAHLVFERAAIVLSENKAYLVEARLRQLMEDLQLGSIGELVTLIKRSPSRDMEDRIVDAMTTNETYFFRDTHPFEELRERVIPDLITKRSKEKSLTFWCAASSTGQEPYSVMMLLREHFPSLANWRLKFIASDLSPTVLEAAKRGRYNQIEVNRGLPANFREKYFARDGAHWVIHESIRGAIEFRRLNLIEPFSTLPAADIVFIRNVLIYFNVDTKRQIFSKLAKLIRPDGYMFLGSSETTLGTSDEFERITSARGSLYQPKRLNQPAERSRV